MVGRYDYRLVLTLSYDLTSYESDIATLTVTNPCLSTKIIDQEVNFTSLNSKYNLRVKIPILAMNDTVDQNSLYGLIANQKCGKKVFSV